MQQSDSTQREIDRHSEHVMARVRSVLGAHAPDLLIAFEGLILMDRLVDAQAVPQDAPLDDRAEVLAQDILEVAQSQACGPVVSRDMPERIRFGDEASKPKTFHNVCRICSKEFESPSPAARYCSEDCRNREPAESQVQSSVCAHCGKSFVPKKEGEKFCSYLCECSLAQEAPGQQIDDLKEFGKEETAVVAATNVDAVIANREKQKELSFQERIAGMIAEGPSLNQPHDAHRLVQLVESCLEFPDEMTGPVASKHMCVVIQATRWILPWVKHHADALRSLKNFERAEYKRQLLAERLKIAPMQKDRKIKIPGRLAS